MARASGAYASEPGAELQRHGNQPQDGSERSHQDGPQAHATCGGHGLTQRLAFLSQVCA